MNEKLKIIQRIIELKFEMEKGQFFKSTRKRPIVLARQIFCFLSLEMIGRLLISYGMITEYIHTYRSKDENRFKHCNIIHAENRIKELLEVDKEIRLLVSDIREDVKLKFTEVNQPEKVSA